MKSLISLNRIEQESRINEIDSPASETKYIETSANVQTSYMMFGWLGPKAAELKRIYLFRFN